TLGRGGLVLAPSGPNNEGYPASAPANGPSVEHAFHSTAIIDNNHLHANPYPNVSGPGQPKLCESANEVYEKGKLVTGNATHVEAKHEFTSREQDLFGQKYPSATLKDLGISTSTKKKSSK